MGAMAEGVVLEIVGELSDALVAILGAAPTDPEPVVLLSAYLHGLAKGYGLSESQHLLESQLERTDPPDPAVSVINHFLSDEPGPIDGYSLRDRLYSVFVDLSRDPQARKALNRNEPLSEVGLLKVAQVFWNLEASATRRLLPISSGQTVTTRSGTTLRADIKVPDANVDFATMKWGDRTKQGASGLGAGQAWKSSGQGFRDKGARLAVLAAKRIVEGNPNPWPTMDGAALHFTPSKSGKQRVVAVVWPEKNRDAPEFPRVATGPRTETSSTPAFVPGDRSAERQRHGGDAERELAAAIGCQIPTFLTDAKPDWRRLLNGAALGPPEVRAGLAVPRSVYVRGQGGMDEQGVLEWMKREPQQPLLLSAPSGEGKSTYCTQLMSAAGSGWLLLRLVAPRRIDWHGVARLQELLQFRLGVPQVPPALVIWEFNAAHLEAPDRNHALDVMQSLATAEFPGPVSLLVAGMPSVIRPLCAAAKGTLAWFEPLLDSDVPQLTSSVRRCVHGIAAESHQGDIDQQFPNVRRFLSMSADRRQSLLLSGHKPLIAGMLEASFGVDWRSRVTSSYDELSKEDRLAYTMVCLGTLVSGGVSSSVVLDASPGADLDARSQYDPWIADESGNQSAIHATIARAVLELCPVEVAIAQSLSSLSATAAQRRGSLQRWSISAIQRILRTLAHWVPVAREGGGSESVRTPAQFRRITRRWVAGEASQLDELIQATSHDIQWAYVWFEVVEGTIPSNAEPGDLNRAVVEVLAAITQHAALLPILTEGQAHCLAFMRSLTEYWTRRTSGEELPVAETVDYVNQWIAYIEEPWVDRAFLFSILRLGFPALFDLAYSAGSDDSADSMLTLCHGLGVSYLRLDAEVPMTGYLEAAYTKMVSNVIPTLWPGQAVAMLNALWMRSVIEGRPSLGTAASMVRRVKVDMQSARQADVARHRARLAQLLEEAVQFHGVIENLDLVVEYLDSAKPDYESLERCERIARDALVRLADNPRTVTFAHDVLSRVLSEQPDVHHHLLLACDGYSRIVRDRSDVVAWDGYWRSALARLRGLDRVAGDQATRDRADRLSRLS